MNLKSLTLPELTATIKELGQPAFRGKQVYTWLHKGVRSYAEMSNLPKGLRDMLSEKYPIQAPEVVRKQESKKDGTIKYLWRLSDGNCVETVLMRYRYGNTVCISTEVGCRMGCAFCASTIGGLVRRLEPYEMLDEVLFTQIDSGLPISHIVLMGISLHGTNDEIRNKVMPVNKAYPMDVLLDACRRYYDATGRRLHFEYAMIDGLNDSEAHARELLQRLKGLGAHVNLIPLNHVEESPLKPSSKAAVAKFQKILEEGGVTATVRRTLGSDIDASCGQLRRKYTKEKHEHTERS